MRLPTKTTLTNAPQKSARRTGLFATLSRRFAREEDGALIIFGLFMFTLMMAISGLAFDLMRYEMHRERLQSTLDRAVLAAAALNQTLDPEDVVVDYFAKADMSDFISRDDIDVTEGLNYRKVEATARVYVPLHHGNFAIFGGENDQADTLVAVAHSTAEEAIGNVEISMVLDVSGSMNSYSRLYNLKNAAKDFLDTVYDAAEPNAVSTSIIPYATQVNAGPTLLSHWNRDDSHTNSFCLNFSSSDFNTTTMPTTTTYEQTVHFDPWTDENDYFDLGDDVPYYVCPNGANDDDGDDRHIMSWSTNKTSLKSYIDGLVATGNTSTDIGVKWGAALLDPSTQSVVTSMIASDDVVDEMDGRPFSYDDGDSMKILVVMTDGAHTSQYYMDDYRSGPSFVWRYESGGTIHYSIWYDGEGSTPITNPSGNYSYCDDWDRGSCYDWDYDNNPEFWFHAYSDNGSYNTYGWRKKPYGGDSAVQMDWSDVWAEIPPEYFSDELLWEMGSMYSSERNQYEYAVNYVGSSTKNSRFANLCSAAKDNNVIIFAVGLEVSSSNATRLQNCSSSVAHYYDVDNLDIGLAFQSIASQINQLRLTQ